MNLTLAKLVFFSVATVLLGVGIVYALSWGLEQGSVQTQPIAEGINEQFGLKLTLMLEKSVYQLGEEINLTLTVTNISNRTVSYGIPHEPHRFDFRVYNSTHPDIYHWSRHIGGWIFEMDWIVLGPGESLVAGPPYSTWPQTCNNQTYLPYSEPPWISYKEGYPVSPGTYYIVGQTGPMSVTNGGCGRIETTPIEITIVKP